MPKWCLPHRESGTLQTITGLHDGQVLRVLRQNRREYAVRRKTQRRLAHETKLLSRRNRLHFVLLLKPAEVPRSERQWAFLIRAQSRSADSFRQIDVGSTPSLDIRCIWILACKPHKHSDQ